MGGLPAGAGRKNPQKTIFIIRFLLGGRLISIALSSTARRLAYCQGRQLFPSSSCCVVSEDSNHSQSLVSPFLAPRRHRSDGVGCSPTDDCSLPFVWKETANTTLARIDIGSRHRYLSVTKITRPCHCKSCCYLQTLAGPQLTPEQARACFWSTGTSSHSASQS